MTRQYKPEAIISPQNTTGRWDPEDFAAIFYRLILDGLKTGEMSPRQAERWGTQCAHWGRVALADRDVQAAGWDAVKSLLPTLDQQVRR